MARFCKNDFFKWAQKIKSVFCFIPHTHEGCDKTDHRARKGANGFNPHTHEGCDVLLLCAMLLLLSFNPHTHEGCDVQGFGEFSAFLVSIHTPTKGVTPLSTKIYDKTLVSIHTPTKGVTLRSLWIHAYL